MDNRLAALGACAPADAARWLDRELLAPCFKVNVRGTTGAGDCTIAGFLAAMLKGVSIERALTAAVAVGACSVEQRSAIGGIVSWEETQHRIDSGWERQRSAFSLPGGTWDEAAGMWRGRANHADCA